MQVIEQWPIDRPIPYARNARKISDKAVDKIAASIKEFGWQQPIVVDRDGVIIAGHTRLQAARKLQLTAVPVHVAKDLTDGQVKAYRLMDNRSHQETDWDLGLLAPELADLQAMSADLALTGFEIAELDALIDKKSVAVEVVESPEGEWQDMPDYSHKDLTSFKKCIVHFRNAQDMAAFEELIGQRIPQNTKALWFPEEAINAVKDLRY